LTDKSIWFAKKIKQNLLKTQFIKFHLFTNMRQDFIVVDTKGKNELNEIALIDSQGKLIYEAFVKNELNFEGLKINAKSLKEIIADFLNLAPSKWIICHYAIHDLCTGQKSEKAVMLSLLVLSLTQTIALVVIASIFRKSDTIAKKAIASRDKFKINML